MPDASTTKATLHNIGAVHERESLIPKPCSMVLALVLAHGTVHAVPGMSMSGGEGAAVPATAHPKN